jgi:hypothetical protein
MNFWLFTLLKKYDVERDLVEFTFKKHLAAHAISLSFLYHRYTDFSCKSKINATFPRAIIKEFS